MEGRQVLTHGREEGRWEEGSCGLQPAPEAPAGAPCRCPGGLQHQQLQQQQQQLAAVAAAVAVVVEVQILILIFRVRNNSLVEI